MKKFREVLNEDLKISEFKREWDALEEDYQEIKRRLDLEEKAEFLTRHSADNSKMND